MLFDDPASLDPSAVVDWFDLCTAALAREEQEAYGLLGAAIEDSPPEFLLNALGIGASQEDVRRYFIDCRRELALAAVLTLIAAAEARIRLDADRRMKSNQDDLAKRLRSLRANAKTEWSIPLYEDGIVEAWKTYIRSLTGLLDIERARMITTIGRFRNLLDLRHWVAHGRYWKIQRGIDHFPPNDAADMVTDLYAAFRSATSHRSLMSFM